MNKRLSLAVFNTQPPNLYFGGVERRILETAKRLLPEIDITIYCGTKKGFKEKKVMNGIQLIPVSCTDKLYPLDNWFFNKNLSKIVRSIQADIYEAHAVSGYGFLKALKKQKIKKTFIQTVHGVLKDEYLQSLSYDSPSLRYKFSNLFMRYLARIEKESSREADLVVTVSKYSAQKIVELYNVSEKRIRIVPNGVDLQKFKPNSNCEDVKEKIAGKNNHLILFVGNLIPRKGLQYLIDAAKLLIKKDNQTKFMIVGDGPLKDNLISYANKEGVSGNFTFLGSVPDHKLPIYYNCADVFVSPSLQEGQGITLLEAQATAKPVIAFDVSAISEVVKNNITGLLVQPDSYELANVISDLLSDKSRREKMGNSGRKFVEKNFSWNVCAQKMFKVYHEALNSMI